MALSLKQPGSPSSALQMIVFGVPFASATDFHFNPVGNPAPPRPANFDSVIRFRIFSGEDSIA